MPYSSTSADHGTALHETNNTAKMVTRQPIDKMFSWAYCFMCETLSCEEIIWRGHGMKHLINWTQVAGLLSSSRCHGFEMGFGVG